MKPRRNKVFCINSERTKMLFPTEKKAKTFMKFNNKAIEEESGYSPKRAYHCMFCGGWYLTSMEEPIEKTRKEQLFEQRYEKTEKKRLKPLNKKTKSHK